MKAVTRIRDASAGRSLGRLFRISFLVLGSALAATALASVAPGGAASHAPKIIRYSTDLGRVAPSSPVDLTFWLKIHNSTALDATLAAQHDHAAPALSDQQIDAQFAPTTTDVAQVSRYLKSQGFKVTGVGPHNMFVKVAATAGLAESSLGVELHNYQLKDTTYRASPISATLPREIAPLVASVGGLSTLAAKPNVARLPVGQRAIRNVARSADAEGIPSKPLMLGANPSGLYYSAQCILPPSSVSFSGAGVSATYQGNIYGQNINNTAFGTVAPCGYQPSDLQTAYNLTPLYNVGLDGTGETVAIVDAYGSTTIAADAAAFSAFMGLPPVNLTIIGTPTESNFSTDANAGWAGETTLDVEWVHAVAPGAKIVLVVTPTNSFTDLFAGILTASAIPGVVAISNSWSGFEAGIDPAFQQSSDAAFKLVGAKGASLQFATGDSGNNVSAIGFYDVGWPGSSPYVTAVGGVSVVLNGNHHVSFQTAWGNNLTELADTIALGSPPLDPPNNEGFVFGGGGGSSDVYPIPSYQRGIGGNRRKIPDISWVADPYTGVEIIYTADAAGDLGIEAIGGTSLATPMFSGLWAIANQKAGRALGNAAPYLYSLPANAITDVVPMTSPNNVTGSITDSAGTSAYDQYYLSLPLQGQQNVYSALYNSPHSTRWFVLTFGTDSTLAAGYGWDPATGLGTPNGWSFVQAFGRHDD